MRKVPNQIEIVIFKRENNSWKIIGTINSCRYRRVLVVCSGQAVIIRSMIRRSIGWSSQEKNLKSNILNRRKIHWESKLLKQNIYQSKTLYFCDKKILTHLFRLSQSQFINNHSVQLKGHQLIKKLISQCWLSQTIRILLRWLLTSKPNQIKMKKILKKVDGRLHYFN